MKTFTILDWSKQEYKVTIEKNTFIQIDCLYKNAHTPKETSTKFMLGDFAEYDSYNLSYIGEIVSITEKTVTIRPQYETTKRRLSLSDFCWRNYNFNLEKTKADNVRESYCI
jgi:hypothetical protein